MHTALRAALLLAVVGVVAGVVLVFATDPAKVPEATNDNIMTSSLTSSVFVHEGAIPSRFTCDGENINPPLTIADVPEGTRSLALIMDDPDAIKPAGKVWDHWVVFNISPDVSEIKEGEEPQGTHGVGTSGSTEYKGPCPPDDEHRYVFRAYALDVTLDVREGATKQEVLDAMEGHIITTVELAGKYKRQ